MFVYLSSLFILGLLLGSFISALTYRIPRGIGYIKGRSFCDNCKEELFWYDNIPLLSYLFYLGKSRCCDKKISIRYPLIEIVSAFGFMVLYLIFGINQQSFVYYLLFPITLSIFIIDLEHQIIPDEFCWIILFIIIFTFGGPTLFLNIFAGFLFAFVFLLLFIVTKGQGMGLGDAKLALPIGVFLGLQTGFIWLFATFLTGGLVASILLITKKAKLKTKIAFGPFMVFAFWIVVLFK